MYSPPLQTGAKSLPNSETDSSVGVVGESAVEGQYPINFRQIKSITFTSVFGFYIATYQSQF